MPFVYFSIRWTSTRIQAPLKLSNPNNWMNVPIVTNTSLTRKIKTKTKKHTKHYPQMRHRSRPATFITHHQHPCSRPHPPTYILHHRVHRLTWFINRRPFQQPYFQSWAPHHLLQHRNLWCCQTVSLFTHQQIWFISRRCYH